MLTSSQNMAFFVFYAVLLSKGKDVCAENGGVVPAIGGLQAPQQTHAHASSSHVTRSLEALASFLQRRMPNFEHANPAHGHVNTQAAKGANAPQCHLRRPSPAVLDFVPGHL
jgi:hypothetical protein